MEEPLCSVFSYQESAEELRQKLLDTTLELENMKNLKTELFNMLTIAYQERDEARDQLQKLVNKLVPSTSNLFIDLPPESLVMPPTGKANSSITESNSLSHVSSPVESLLEPVSSPEFSNVNVVDSHNLGYLNQPLVQDFNGSQSPALVSCEKPISDPGNAVIDYLAKGKVLPQKGKLLQAVMDAGPLLQTLILAGPLPTWRNPPPLQAIKIPNLSIKDFDTPKVEMNSFANTESSFQKRTLASSHMLNFAGGNPSGSLSNAWQLTPNVSFDIHALSRNRQRRHCF